MGKITLCSTIHPATSATRGGRGRTAQARPMSAPATASGSSHFGADSRRVHVPHEAEPLCNGALAALVQHHALLLGSGRKSAAANLQSA